MVAALQEGRGRNHGLLKREAQSWSSVSPALMRASLLMRASHKASSDLRGEEMDPTSWYGSGKVRCRKALGMGDQLAAILVFRATFWARRPPSVCPIKGKTRLFCKQEEGFELETSSSLSPSSNIRRGRKDSVPGLEVGISGILEKFLAKPVRCS